MNTEQISKLYFDRAALQRAYDQTKQERDNLLEACQWFFAQLEAGTLVRDISKDGANGWHKAMIDLTMGLSKAQQAIDKAQA